MILLDMGGVLVDTGPDHALPWGAFEADGRAALLGLVRSTGGRAEDGDLDRLLFDPWRAGYRRRYERGREEPWEPHLERLRRETGAAAPAADLLTVWAGPYAASLRPLPGAAEAVARLADSGAAIAVVSNVPLPGRLYLGPLERTGMAARFSARLFSYDAGTRKPEPGLLLAALERLGAAPSVAVMVGDRRSTDVAAARAAGVRAVWIESDDADGPEPDATIGSLADLPDLLAAWP